MKDVHPAMQGLLHHFDFSVDAEDNSCFIHDDFYRLAERITEQFEGPEATVALRKLLEAKDCAVRSARRGEVR